MTQNHKAKTPVILQLEATECGAATLGMILGYHGRIVPLADLRHQCGVSRDGSKASNVLKAARHYGMLAKGFSKDVKDLQSIAPPFIVFWNFNHFIVVEGFGKNTVAVNDPASGHRVVSDQEFDRSFTGVALLMEPGPEFEKGGRKPSVVKAITDRLAGSVTAVAYCAVVGFLLVIPGLAIPAFSQIFLDTILLEGHTNWLRPLILAMIIAMLMQGTLKFLQLHYLRRVKMMLSIKLSSGFMWHSLQLPATFYAQRFAGEVAERSTLNDKLADVLSGRLAQTTIDVVMLGFYAALMLFYDVVLASIGIVFAIANVLVLRWVSDRRVEANMLILQESGKAQGTAIAGLQSMETIKAAGQESGFFGKWSGYYTKSVTAGQDLALSNQTLSVVPTFLSSLMLAVLIIVGGFRIINGHLTIGMLVAFQSLLNSFMSPITNLLNLGSTFQELQGDLNRVDDILQHPLEHSPNRCCQLEQLAALVEW
ncbi:MAG TPA: hypothetical protein EYN74_02785 [Nitrospirales bacterium]|nr:hypothetical protein [Nitrospirales bacterium]